MPSIGRGSARVMGLVVLVLGSIAAGGPVAAAGDDVKAITVGDNYFACALKLDATVWCWGDNEYHELGDGTTVLMRTTPVRVKRQGGELKNITQIDAGSYHACARRGDGTAWCWGEASQGKLGNQDPGAEPLRAVQVVGLTDVKQVVAGLDHSCALKTGGSVFCWGAGAQLGDGENESSAVPVRVRTPLGFLTGVTAIAATHRVTCAIRSDFTLHCWGEGGPALQNLEDVSVARYLKVGAGATFGPRTVSVGGNHICVTRASGEVRCHGGNSAAQLGDGGFADQVKPQLVETTTGLLPAATVVAAGAGVSCAAAGPSDHVFCWGSNADGRAGTGSDPGPLTAAIRMKRANGNPIPALAIASGDSLTCVVRTDRAVFCTGYGSTGGIGNGSTDSVDVATRVLFPD